MVEQKANTRTLEISGMTCDACVQKVTTALKGVQGVSTLSVKVGSATIACDHQSQSQAACAAINALGYQASETACVTEKNGTCDGAATSGDAKSAEPSKANQNMVNEGASGAIGGSATGSNKVEPAVVSVPAKPAIAAGL